MAEPVPQLIIDNNLQAEWEYATQLDDQLYLDELLEQATKLNEGTLGLSGVERARDPFAATPELIKAVKPDATTQQLEAAEKRAYPTGRDKTIPPEPEMSAGAKAQAEAEANALEAGTFYSPEYRLQQRTLEQGLIDAELQAFRALRDAYMAEGDSPTIAMRKAKAELQVITGAFYEPSGKRVKKGKEGAPYPFPLEPEERGPFERQMIESPSQVEERQRQRKKGAEVYDNLRQSFNLQAYDIIFDENDQRRSDQEIRDKQREANLVVDHNRDFTTIADELEKQFKGRDLTTIVRNALVFQMKAQGMKVPVMGDPNYQEFVQAQVAMQNYYLAQVFQEDSLGQSIDPKKASLTDRFVKDLFTTEIDGGVVESQTARGLRVVGGLIRPVSNFIVGGMTYEIDENNQPVDPNDMNYKMQQFADELIDDGSVFSYIVPYVVPAQPIKRPEGARESGYVSHDNYLDATLHDIKVGRFLGDDFVSMPFLAEGLGQAFDTDPEAAAMSLGLITEIGLPLTPAGTVGMTMKAAGKPIEVGGKLVKSTKITQAGESLMKAGDAVLPENILARSTSYYRLKQTERAMGESGMKGTLGIDEAATPRMARDFDGAVSGEQNGAFVKDRYDKLKPSTPDGERAISEAASIHQEVDEIAKNLDNINDTELDIFIQRHPTGSKVLADGKAGGITTTELRGLLQSRSGQSAVKQAFTYETFQTFLANRLPKDWIFVTPTMVAKQSSYKQIYDEVSGQLSEMFKGFTKTDDGFKWTGDADVGAAIEEIAQLRGFQFFDIGKPLTDLELARINDYVKEAFIEKSLLQSGDGGKIGYVSDKAYDALNIPNARRYQGTIISQALSPIAIGAIGGFALGGPVGGLVGLAASPLAKALAPLADIPKATTSLQAARAGKAQKLGAAVKDTGRLALLPVGYAAKLADNISEAISKIGITAATRTTEGFGDLGRGVAAYYFGKPQITPTMPLQMKRLFETVKSEIRAIPRNLTMEIADDIRAGKDPVKVFEEKLNTAVQQNSRYQLTLDGINTPDLIQGDNLFAVDFVRGFFGDKINFLTDAEIIKYGFGGGPIVGFGGAPLAFMKEGIGKLRSRFTQLDKAGFGGKFMGDDFASYATLFILEARAKTVFNTRLTEVLGEDEFLRLTTRQPEIGVADDIAVAKMHSDRVLRELGEQIDEVADTAAVATAKQALSKVKEGQTLSAQQRRFVDIPLENIVNQYRNFIASNADAITSGYFTAKGDAMLKAGLETMVEAVIRGEDYTTIIETFKANVINTLVSDTIVADMRVLVGETKATAVRDAMKILEDPRTINELIRGAIVEGIDINFFGIRAEEFLQALERNGLVVNRTKYGKESVRALQPQLIPLGESGKIMIGNKLTAETYDNLVNSFRTGNYQQAIEGLNTRSLTLGDYAANRVGQFVNGVSRSMRNGLLAGKYIFNGRYLGINNISQPFIMATTTPNFVGRALQRTIINVATLGIDPIAISNTLKRAGTALPVGGLATGATIGGLAFGAPVAGGVIGAAAGTALLAKGNLTSLVSKAYEKFLGLNPQVRNVNLGVFYSVNDMEKVYFTDAFGKQWTGRMINDAIKRNDIYLTQVSYEFGEDAIEDIVKVARIGKSGEGLSTLKGIKDIAIEASSYIMPNKKSLANILAEETDLAFRQQVFISGLGMGLAEDQAAALARASLFDYGGINNKLERDIARRFFLFYAFMRQSGVETARAMLSPNRAAIIGTQARFAQNQKKKAELDILLQTTPFITQRRKQLASSYAYITNAYQQHFYAVYGPAFPMVESYLQLQDAFVNVANLNIIDPLLQTAVGANPLTQQASRELQAKRMGASELAPQGYLGDRDLVAFQQLGLLTQDWLDFFDLEPAEPPSRANMTIKGQVDGQQAPPLFTEGYRLRFRSAQGATRYRIMKAIGSVVALDRSIMDYTSSQVIGDGRVPNLEDIQYRQLKDGSYDLYIRGLATPIKVPTYLQMELDILNSQINDLRSTTKQRKPRKKK